jgi:hypothetical protein
LRVEMRAGGVPRLRVNLYQGIVEYLQQYFLLPGRPNALSGKHSPSTKSSTYVVPAESEIFLRYLGRRDARAGAQALMVSGREEDDSTTRDRCRPCLPPLLLFAACSMRAFFGPAFSLAPQYLVFSTL